MICDFYVVMATKKSEFFLLCCVNYFGTPPVLKILFENIFLLIK